VQTREGGGTRRARRGGREGGREGGLRNQKGFGPGERGERGEGEDSSASTRHYVAAGTNLYKGGVGTGEGTSPSESRARRGGREGRMPLGGITRGASS